MDDEHSNGGLVGSGAEAPSPSREAEPGSDAFGRGKGWRADCPKCVASKFTCDEHYVSGADGSCGSQRHADEPLQESGRLLDFVVQGALAAIEGRTRDLVRKAADDFYTELLYSVQNYLCDNAKFNIKSRLESAERQALQDRLALQVERAKASRLLDALQEIDAMPLYDEPVPAEWVEGLRRRYNKAVKAAGYAVAQTELRDGH